MACSPARHEAPRGVSYDRLFVQSATAPRAKDSVAAALGGFANSAVAKRSDRDVQPDSPPARAASRAIATAITRESAPAVRAAGEAEQQGPDLAQLHLEPRDLTRCRFPQSPQRPARNTPGGVELLINQDFGSVRPFNRPWRSRLTLIGVHLQADSPRVERRQWNSPVQASAVLQACHSRRWRRPRT